MAKQTVHTLKGSGCFYPINSLWMLRPSDSRREILMRSAVWIGHSVSVLIIAGITGLVAGEERTQRFDRDPGWESHNNRSTTPGPRQVRQDFGFSNTSHAGGKAGELGGFITPAAEPAYYAKKLSTKTFGDTLTASGTLACTGRKFHALIGFFNADTLNEWRTPNTIALRISGRGDVFYAWLEYATQRLGRLALHLIRDHC